MSFTKLSQVIEKLELDNKRDEESLNVSITTHNVTAEAIYQARYNLRDEIITALRQVKEIDLIPKPTCPECGTGYVLNELQIDNENYFLGWCSNCNLTFSLQKEFDKDG